MKSKTILLAAIAAMVAAVWIIARQGGGQPVGETPVQVRDRGPRAETKSHVRNAVRPRQPRVPATDDALNEVRSPLAARFLRLLQDKNGRLAGESHAPSMVNNAFIQFWQINARLELTEDQQDRLAGFLLEKDWVNLNEMDQKSLDDWARANLSEEQQSSLKALVMASKSRELRRYDAKMRRKYGDATREEIIAAEANELSADMAALAKAVQSPGTLIPGQNAPGKSEEIRRNFAANAAREAVERNCSALADRIPLSDEQYAAIHDALSSGAEAPLNPYLPYSSTPPEGIEQAVREKTSWMARILDREQYETYVSHFSAVIEMVKFQERGQASR